MHPKVIEISDKVCNNIIKLLEDQIQKENNADVKFCYDSSSNRLEIITESYDFYDELYNFSISDLMDLLDSLGHSISFKEVKF